MIPDRYTDALIANLEDAHSHHPNPKGRSDWAGAIHLRAALLFQSLRYPSATTPADETNKLAYQLAADCCRMITALKLDPYFPPAPKE